MTHRIIVLLFAIQLLSIAAFAGQTADWSTCEYVKGHLIVTFDESLAMRIPSAGTNGILAIGVPSLDALFQEFEVSAAWRLVPDETLNRLKVQPDFYQIYVLRFRDEYPVLSVLNKFASNPFVKHIEPDLLSRAYRIPNDTRWGNQWDKRIVNADDVWEISTGSADIICAGIDTGVDWNHPDLVANLWVNPGEDLNHNHLQWDYNDYPGDTEDMDGQDNDQNGYIDDFLGWDFIRNIGGCATGEDCDNRMDNDMFGMNGHGTHVGGLMCARGNNSIGVAGMCWVGTLMALRAGFEDTEGNGYMPESATVPAILYAAANGAKVLNMSYGGPGASDVAQNAINAAWDSGCLLFAASGNDGSTTPGYPAACDNVIAVNATNNQDRLASWSNRGTWTHLCAPGADPGCESTIVDGYAAWEGTSMASPNAAGVGALVWSVFPTFTNAQIRDLLFNTAQSISALNPNVPASHLGHGRIDAQHAVASLFPFMQIIGSTLTDATGGDGDGRLESGESAQVVIQFRNQTGWANGSQISTTISTLDPSLSLTNATFFLGDIPSGQTANNSANPVTITAGPVATPHWATLTATFSSPTGYTSQATFTIRVGRGQILLVDDDGTESFEQYYATSLSTLAYSYDTWSVNLDGALSQEEIQRYSVILWICGNQSTSTLTAANQTSLGQFLDGGGNLILVGQNIDEDISASTFYSTYLHAQSEHMAGNRQLNGVSGNAISNGMSLLLQGGGCGGNGLLSPSRILPAGDAQATFTYTNGGTGAVMYAGTYKVAYFAFALEAACGLSSTTNYQTVLSSVLGWMGILDTPEPSSSSVMPTTLALRDNYPNPFNPKTTISFDLPVSASVSLKIYNLQGREVSAIVDNVRMSAGQHEVEFDGSALASGVYFARLQSMGTILSKKMILIK